MSNEREFGTGRERQSAFGQQITREDRRKLGALLRSLRVDSGLQQGELAARIGVSQSVLQKIEYGFREVTVLELVVIARGLNVSPVEIVSLLMSDLP